MRELSSHPSLDPDQAIDFKLAAAEARPVPAVTLETGMHTLSVKLCKVRAQSAATLLLGAVRRASADLECPPHNVP